MDSKKRNFNQYGGSKKQQRDEEMELLFPNKTGDDDDDYEQGAGTHTRDFEQTYEAEVDDDVNMGEDNIADQENSDEPDDAEDLDDRIDDDYRENLELDRYEEVGIDDQDYGRMNHNERLEADRELARQERLANAGRVRGAAALHDDDESEDERLANNGLRRMMNADGEEMEQDFAQVNEYEEHKGDLGQWIVKKEVTMYTIKTFQNFLRSFRDEKGVHKYEELIQKMCQNNKCSFELNFTDLSSKHAHLCLWLAEEPAKMIPIFNQAAAQLVEEVYPDYLTIHKEIFVRIGGLPVEDKLRELRQVHLNALIKFCGVVTKRTGVFPQYQEIYLRCECGDLKGPIYEQDVSSAKANQGRCLVCQSAGRYTVDEVHTIYRNYQKLTIQETPGTVPPGRVPRQKEVYVLHDLVDTARPGDQVEVTGIFINRFDYFANIKHGFPVFQTIVEANNLKRFGDEDIIELTDVEKQEILSLSKTPDIEQKLINSIAPSIYGHNFIKKALLCAMFGGEAKDVEKKHRIRGDINVLLLGDPGTAKSQFLKYVEKVYHRVVYTTGKGASAVGLTAGVHRDPITGEWTLEGGALVLADKGICLIDEFDKMNDQDRTSIHEAMEQQSISISKAGIVTSLQARSSVIAAANPIGGVYNPSNNFNDNVDLSDPILSRFDILTVIRDEVKREDDDDLATFVINSHIKNHPELKAESILYTNDQEYEEEAQRREQQLLATLMDESQINRTKREMTIEQEMLKKYIIYAKRYVKPRLNDIDQDKITNFYAQIRKESNVAGGIAIAARHLESVIRMSEAHAKMFLRDYVTHNDIDFAIDMLLESFLQSQKVTIARQLSAKLQRFKLQKNEMNSLLYHILDKEATKNAAFTKKQRNIEEVEKVAVEIPISTFKTLARDYGANEIETFFKSSHFAKKFRRDGNSIKTVIEL